MDFTATETIEVTEHDRTCLLVGKYLSAWAHMESQIDSAIRQGLGLTTLQGAIVCVNANFISKCHILQTLESLGRPKKKGNKHNSEKAIEKLKELSNQRNMIAHTGFFPGKTEEGEFCVVFAHILAKGKLDLPNVKWTEKNFELKIEELYEYASKIKEVGKSLSSRKLVDALLKTSNPKPPFGLFKLGSSDFSSNQPLGLLGLLGGFPSTPEKDAQAPE